jgi:hypothetical protein
MGVTGQPASAARHRPGGSRRRPILYLVLPLLLVALAVFGFWPQYYGRLVTGVPLEGVSLHPLVHVHSSLFIGWLLIILGQVTLVHAGRTRVHRRIGPWLAGVGYATAGVGLYSGLNLAAARVARGGSLDEAAVFVAAPILDMIMFVGFLTAAVLWRGRPEIHKRMIFFTGYSFAFIGLVRYLARAGMMQNLWLATFLLLTPVLACIAWEAATRRSVHPAWWIGLGAFTARLLLELLAVLPPWLPVGRALIRPFV